MTQNFVSKNNSTTVALGAGASFVGSPDILTSWQELDINVAGAPANAPGTLYIEFGPDPSHWDVSVPLYLTGPQLIPTLLRAILPVFRVRYVNGPTPLTEFRLTINMHRTTATRLTRFLHQRIDPNEPVEIVRVADGPEKKLYDLASPTVNYIGQAPPGTTSSAAYWRIKRLRFNATTGDLEDSMWSSYYAVWDNRASEAYS